MPRVGSPLLILFVDIYFYIYHMIQLSFFCKQRHVSMLFFCSKGLLCLYTHLKEKKEKTNTVPDVSRVT